MYASRQRSLQRLRKLRKRERHEQCDDRSAEYDDHGTHDIHKVLGTAEKHRQADSQHHGRSDQRDDLPEVDAVVFARWHVVR